MRKMVWKCIISFTLICSMLLISITGCNNKNKEKGKWSEPDTSEITKLQLEVIEDGEHKDLVVSYETDIFNEGIQSDDLKVYATKISGEGISEYVEIKDYQLTQNSSKQIIIGLPQDSENLYYNYSVTVHSSVTTNNKYAETTAVTDTYTESVQYSANITGEYTIGDVNPEITVELENTVLADNADAGCITLGGVFQELNITNIVGSGNTVKITTQGIIKSGTPLRGDITFAGEATNSGKVLTDTCDVKYVGAYVDDTSYTFDDNRLIFSIKMNGEYFTVSQGDILSTDELELTVQDISEDNELATVFTTIETDSLDHALEMISGKNVTIGKNKTTGDTDIMLQMPVAKAQPVLVVEYVSEAESRYQADAVLYAKNGSLAKISAEDFKFTDIGNNLKIDDVSEENGQYKLTFTFDSEYIDPENILLNGTLLLTEGCIINSWGTSSDILSCEVVYTVGTDRGETLDAIKAFVAANKDTFETISTVGSAVGGVASAASGVMTILEMVGVLESTDDKLNSIRNEIFTTQEMISNLNSKIDALGDRLMVQTDTIISKQDKTLYLQAQNSWESFITNYIIPLSNVKDSYKSAYKEYILQFINKAGNGDSLNVYIDANGKVTLPGTLTGYSIDGVPIASVTECRLSVPLSAVKDKVVKNGGRLYAGYEKDIEAFIKENGSDFESDCSVGNENYIKIQELAIEKNPDAYNISEYNFAVYMIKERGMSLKGLKSNFIAWVPGNDQIAQQIYDILSEGKYIYNENKIAECGSFQTVEWKSESIIRDKNGNIADISSNEYITALYCDAAVYAMNKVGRENIINAFTNFCYGLGGNKMGGPVSSSDMTPLDYYYTKLSYYYNFYSEAEDDINNMITWLNTFLVETSGVATLACQYTTSYDADTILKAYNYAVNQMEKKNGKITVPNGSQYSYVVGKNISMKKVYVVENNTEMVLSTQKKNYAPYHIDLSKTYEELEKYLAKKNLKMDMMNIFLYFEEHLCSKDETLADISGYATASDIVQMNNRYNVLKEAKVTTAAGFADYLLAAGLLTEELKEGWIVTSEEETDIPKDNRISLNCIEERGDYFSVGSSYSIGNNGKLEAEYFVYGRQLNSQVFDLSNNSVSTKLIGGCSRYSEDHWYWKVTEEALFRYGADNTLVFVIN